MTKTTDKIHALSLIVTLISLGSYTSEIVGVQGIIAYWYNGSSFNFHSHHNMYSGNKNVLNRSTPHSFTVFVQRIFTVILKCLKKILKIYLTYFLRVCGEHN